ncbi:MAG: 2-amino-4-hydroxy-6-hydroxymethyldihydropteridine diphosphokinase, partial [Dehalococcoidia bacterium]
AACEVETSLSPHELLAHAKSVEHAIGRRPAERWSPRPIDIDILLYDDQVIDSGELVVPHPRLLDRNFVLVPLAELAPDVEHPRERRPIGELAEQVDYDGLEHVSSPSEWWQG